MSTSLKTLREQAEALVSNGIKNKTALVDALPVLIDLQRAIESAQHSAKASKATAAALSDACSAYALDHQSVFDEGLILIGKGVRSGDLTIDDETYHFTSGYDKPKRIDGDALSQDFLSGLPKDWTKTKVELDTTGINRLKVEDAALQEAGLYRPEKNEWSM